MDNDRLARTGQTPLDWANDLAATIIADVHARRYTDAESLIAARLRLVRQEGVVEGAKDTAAAVERAFRPVTPALQREYAADVAEYGQNGCEGQQ